MNARLELDRALDAADALPIEEPPEAEQREFFAWAEVVNAERVLRTAIESGNALAVTYTRGLARLLDEPGREPRPVPTENRLASGPPPF